MWSDKHQKIGIFQGGEQSGGTGEQRGYETPQGYFVSDQCYHDWELHLGTIMKIMNHQKRCSFFPSPASILFGDRFRDDELLFMARFKAHMDGASLQLSAGAADED
jgi:hypothetical protein